ncbi:hypothetical protein [uncultured Cytophaga sp.]|uniref:hypothetical protein n=1 Tax=uncultured Cytophaga sp. TaxID=160238 RepID=UPI0026190226|nr:hypothetical protein [uncultured Cytophaga sp.]
MIFRATCIVIASSMLIACSPQTSTNTETLKDTVRVEEKQADNTQSNGIDIDDLTIPTSWTEVTRVNNQWVYAIPCQDKRALQTIDLTTDSKSNAILWDWGTAGQLYTLKKVRTVGDSMLFETLLPYDTTEIALFTMTYLDKSKNIVRWGADGSYCTYIPTADTSKFTKIQYPCDEVEQEQQ